MKTSFIEAFATAREDFSPTLKSRANSPPTDCAASWAQGPTKSGLEIRDWGFVVAGKSFSPGLGVSWQLLLEFEIMK